MTPLRLLVTRPEPDAERTAAALRALGHEVLVAPLLRMQAIGDAPLGGGPWAGLVATSANALRAIRVHPACAGLLNLPLLAVGRRTAEVARECGFTSVRSADGDAGDLANLATATFATTATPVLYLVGENRAVDLAGVLHPRGITVRTVEIYRMVKARTFPDAAADALTAGRIEGVLHYSRRSAQAYLACAEAAGLAQAALEPMHACLSDDIAADLRAAGATTIMVAARPEESALLRLFAPA